MGTTTARIDHLAGALVLILAHAGSAAADGERSPMLGAAFLGAWDDHTQTESLGAGVEAAWWRGRCGLAAEGSMRWDPGGGGAHATVLGASARVRLFEHLLPSLLEPRDVELGLELHAIIQRTWWSDDRPTGDPVGHGLGVAVRLRGGSDDDFSSLLAESRLFVRVISAHGPASEVLARGAAPMQGAAREWTIFVGLGAAFGTGEPAYLDRFRARPFDALGILR